MQIISLDLLDGQPSVQVVVNSPLELARLKKFEQDSRKAFQLLQSIARAEDIRQIMEVRDQIKGSDLA